MVLAPTDQKPDSPNTTRCVDRTSLAPQELLSAATIGWYISADLRPLSRCRTSGHTVEELPSRSTAGLSCSQFFSRTDNRSQLRSFCSRTVRTLRAAPPSSRSYHHEDSRLNSSRNNSLLDLFLDPTSLFEGVGSHPTSATMKCRLPVS